MGTLLLLCAVGALLSCKCILNISHFHLNVIHLCFCSLYLFIFITILSRVKLDKYI